MEVDDVGFLHQRVVSDVIRRDGNGVLCPMTASNEVELSFILIIAVQADSEVACRFLQLLQRATLSPHVLVRGGLNHGFQICAL